MSIAKQFGAYAAAALTTLSGLGQAFGQQGADPAKTPPATNSSTVQNPPFYDRVFSYDGNWTLEEAQKYFSNLSLENSKKNLVLIFHQDVFPNAGDFFEREFKKRFPSSNEKNLFVHIVWKVGDKKTTRLFAQSLVDANISVKDIASHPFVVFVNGQSVRLSFNPKGDQFRKWHDETFSLVGNRLGLEQKVSVNADAVLNSKAEPS